MMKKEKAADRVKFFDSSKLFSDEFEKKSFGSKHERHEITFRPFLYYDDDDDDGSL